MPIIDTHLHLFPSPLIAKEGDWELNDLKNNLFRLSGDLEKRSIDRGLVIILDTDFIKNDAAMLLLKTRQADYPNLLFCFMLDFRAADSFDLLRRAKESGAVAVKIHPRLQKICEDDFATVEKFARAAERMGLFLIVDCAYLSRDLYKYSGIKLVAHLGGAISCPIVMAHAGAPFPLEAFSVASDSKNVFLETSFALSYWKGSSVEQDIAFAVKKLGAGRCLYGSDAPFISLCDSLQTFDAFSEKYNLSKAEIVDIMYNTANKILNNYRK